MIDLYYSGGSGGNFLLHLILLSKHHICSFENYPPSTDDNFMNIFNKVFNTQWEISRYWKDSEIIPSNTIVSSKKYDSITFTCLFCNIERFVKVKTCIFSRNNTSISVYANPTLLKNLVEYKINPQYNHNTDYMSIVNEQIESRILISEQLANIVDYKFSLNNIINTGGKNVCNALNIPHTPAHNEFVNKWVNLHPPHIKQLLS